MTPDDIAALSRSPIGRALVEYDRCTKDFTGGWMDRRDIAEAKLISAITESGWRPIAGAELGQIVWLWSPGWRHSFPGRRIGDFGQVEVDTCETEAKGWITFATHFREIDAPLSGENKAI